MKCTCEAHGIPEGRCGTVAKIKFAQVWPREMCQRIRAGIQSPIRHRRRQVYVHDPIACYPIHGVLSSRHGRGRLRKNPEGIASKDGVIYDCPVCMRRLHEHHPNVRVYQHEPSKWSCETCLRVRPADGSDHALVDGCRLADGEKEVARRVTKQFGQQAKVGPG